MARREFHNDCTAIAHALVDLVKDGILTREGKPRRYQYAQYAHKVKTLTRIKENNVWKYVIRK